MLVTLSPAKSLDFAPQTRTRRHSEPLLLRESRILIRRLREFSVEDLMDLMQISRKLAEENQQRFRRWRTPFTMENAKQAVLAFQGEVYQGLYASPLKAAELKFAQDHLRILSGLYGVLRPLDLIQAYRLEMGCRLTTPQGDDLYEFWGDRITKVLNQALDERSSDLVVNLASNEYFRAVNRHKLAARVITPAFKEFKDGKLRMVSFYAKRARGLMAAFILQRHMKDPDELREFDREGYRYDEAFSSGDQWVFTRNAPS